MANTVNASVIVTRDGTATSKQLKNISYSKLVAMEIGLVSALSQLVAWGAARAAGQLEPGGRVPQIGGQSDVKFELRTDHGAGGSEFCVAYTGLSVQMAAMILCALEEATETALVAP